MGLKRASAVALCPEVGVERVSRAHPPGGQVPAGFLLPICWYGRRLPGHLVHCMGGGRQGSCVFPQVLGSLASPLPLSTLEISAICLLYCFGGGVILSGDEQGKKRLHTLPSPPPGCQAEPSNLASLGLG